MRRTIRATPKLHLGYRRIVSLSQPLATHLQGDMILHLTLVLYESFTHDYLLTYLLTYVDNIACALCSVWHSGQSEDSSMMPGETRARPSAVRMVAAPYPVDTFCSNCGKVVVTVVEHEPGTCTYLSISVLVVPVKPHLQIPVNKCTGGTCRLYTSPLPTCL